MPISPIQHSEITLTFTPAELLQLEAFATLHGVSVSSFVQRAALEAAQITVAPKDPPLSGALWADESLAPSLPKEEVFDFFLPLEQPEETQTPPEPLATPPAPKRGVAGEPSSLARGHGMVWEIRRALGAERVHGLGWTREHLAFVLKLSVVGVRKMEHLGTSPVKSLEARKNLLELARLLEKPSPEIAAYIETEAASLG